MAATINIDEYIKEYETLHPPKREPEVPRDPSKKGGILGVFSLSSTKDPLQLCVEKCKFSLYQTALVESGGTLSDEKNRILTDEQRTVHVRLSRLQAQCLDACRIDSLKKNP